MTYEQSYKLLVEAHNLLNFIDKLFWIQPILDNKLARIRSRAANRVYRRWVMTFGK